MSVFDDVVEYAGEPETDRETELDSSIGEPMITTTANVPEVGRVEAWLAQQGLTVSEAALLVNAASMAVIALSLAIEVQRNG